MPPTAAILGASRDRSKFGNKSLRAHRQAGYDVYPVNPRGGEMEGESAVATLAEVPVPLDRITVYLPPATTYTLLAAMAAAEPGEIFFNPGSADATVIAEASRLGLPFRQACSIVDLGLSPADF